MPRVIGTANESGLHRRLKLIYAGEGGRTEVELSGFIADAVGSGGELVEIQTGSFAPLRKKAAGIVPPAVLKIVCPVIVAKYLEYRDAEGAALPVRKSSRTGKVWDLFKGLVYAPELPLLPGVEVELALVDVAEERIRDGKGSWRRGGVSIGERRLLNLRERICLKKPADYLRFVPFAKNEEFSSGDLAGKAKIRVNLARKTLYVLVRLGIAGITGRQGNSNLYRLLVTPRTKNWKKIP